MRLIWELSKRALHRQMTYRAAMLAGLVTNIFFGFLRVALFVALYGAREEVAGISLAGVVTYTGITQAVIGYLSLFRWFDLMDSIHTGEVASDLLKPIHPFLFWLAQDFGRALVSLLVRGASFMLLFELYFDVLNGRNWVQHPRGWGWVALALVLALSWLVSFAWRFLVNLSAFWSPNARGVGRFAFALAWFFSGFLVPLRFFPDGLARLSYLTPFPHMINTVVEVYLGLLDGRALIGALLMQALWAVGLIVVGQLVLRAGVRRLVILGG